MTSIPMPTGWTALERHLVETHGVNPEWATHADSDLLRQVHRESHDRSSFTLPHDHQVPPPGSLDV